MVGGGIPSTRIVCRMRGWGTPLLELSVELGGGWGTPSIIIVCIMRVWGYPRYYNCVKNERGGWVLPSPSIIIVFSMRGWGLTSMIIVCNMRC